MTLGDFEQCIAHLFGPGQLAQPGEEWGFTHRGREPVVRVGYCTNLTPDTVAEAVRSGVDVLVTHHDAWSFLGDMPAQCRAELERHRISHCFFHLPLDAADFGTSATLAERLGLRIVGKTHLERDTWLCGRVGEYGRALEPPAFQARLSDVLQEPVRAWWNGPRPVRRVCVVTGGAFLTDHLAEAVANGCDTYVTGEKVLYTIEYARHAGIHLLVGSHTFTELPGVESLVRRACAVFPGVVAVSLAEEHLE